MKYLVVGGGGREHAVAAALAREGEARIAAVMATRNPGIAALADSVLLSKETEVERVVGFAMPAPRIDAAMEGLWREVLTLAPPEPTADTEPTPDTEPSTGFQET